MAAHAYLIVFKPMPAPSRGQERVRMAANGVTFNLDRTGG
jgi:hypothetical protein